MRKWIFCALALLLIAGISIRIAYVNIYSPKLEVEKYAIGDWVPLDGSYLYSDKENTAGYEVRVIKSALLTYKEYIAKYNLPANVLEEELQPCWVLDLTMEFRNRGSSSDGCIFLNGYNLYAEKDKNSFNFNSSLTVAVTPELPQMVVFNVHPNEKTKAISVPFTSAAMIVGNKIEEKGKFPKYLVVSTTPIKKMIEIPG